MLINGHRRRHLEACRRFHIRSTTVDCFSKLIIIPKIHSVHFVAELHQLPKGMSRTDVHQVEMAVSGSQLSTMQVPGSFNLTTLQRRVNSSAQFHGRQAKDFIKNFTTSTKSPDLICYCIESTAYVNLTGTVMNFKGFVT